MNSRLLIIPVLALLLICSCAPENKEAGTSEDEAIPTELYQEIQFVENSNENNLLLNSQTLRNHLLKAPSNTDFDITKLWTDGTIGTNNSESGVNENYLLLNELDLDNSCISPEAAPEWRLCTDTGMQVYYFNKSSKTHLKLLGFGGINLKGNEIVCIAEYSQRVSIPCADNNDVTWGFGIRMMMHVKSSEKGAKLDNPSKIAASVTFGYASVSYSIKTFGVAGPGIADFIDADDMTTNSYGRFTGLIAKFIREIYSTSNTYDIDPRVMLVEPNGYSDLVATDLE
tara:strand:+ start:759 stop:1613 length:855 start_codon:yes stop_codon:yes gene_type:complete